MSTPEIGTTTLPPDQPVVVVDDNPNPPPLPAVNPTPAPAPAVAEEAPAPQPRIDPRAAIAERFKAHRREEEGEPAPPDDFQKPPFIQKQEAEAAAAAEELPADPAAPAAAPTPEQRFKLKVDRKEIEVGFDELADKAGIPAEIAAKMPQDALVVLAQKNMAADARLDEAKRLKDEVRAAAPAQPANPPEKPATTAEPARRADQPVDSDIVQLVEKIQFGDPQEAANALQSAITTVATKANQTQFAQVHSQEVQSALDTFAKANPDLVDDEELSGFLFSAATSALKAELIAAGLSEEGVHAIVKTPDDAARAYIEARMAGMKVRPPAEILNQAATKLRTRLGMTKDPAPAPAPAPTPQPAPQPAVDRTTAKRALAPQPTRANGQPVVNPAQAPPTRSSVVTEMRRARGQPV